MEQSESIIELLKTLCRHHAHKSSIQEFRQRRKLFTKAFSILLKLPVNKGKQRWKRTSEVFSDVDFVYSEIFKLRLSQHTHKARRLESLVHLLEDKDGNLNDNVASCLKFLLSLSNWTANEKSTELFQHIDVHAYESNNPEDFGSYFRYKNYPSSVFEESHYPSLDASKYSSELFGCFGEGSLNVPSSKVFSQMNPPSDVCSYFGAIHKNSAKNDLNMLLELPLLTESNLDRPMYCILNKGGRKTESEDNGSEDEGFVDPQIDYSPELYDDTDIWEKACQLQSNRHLTWETQYQHNSERPFLCHSGPDSTSAIHLSYLQNLHFVNPSLQPSTVKKLTTRELSTHIIHVLLGVESRTFQYDKITKAFVMQSQVQVPGLTPDSLQHLLTELMDCGSCCKSLEVFSVAGDVKREGRLGESFKEGMRQYLQYYRAAVLHVAENYGHSVLQLHYYMSNLIRQMRYMSELCFLGEHKKKSFPTGLKILDYLYEQSLQQWDGEHYLVLLFLLKIASVPYVRFLQEWLFEGVCNDPFGEFNIKINSQYISSRNELFWTKGFVPASVKQSAPFLKENSTIVLCGKALNLLRICCPKHSLFDGLKKRPELSFSLSKKKLEQISEASKDYLESMTGILELQQRIRRTQEEKNKIERHKVVVKARHLAAAHCRLQKELYEEKLQQMKLKKLQYRESLSQQIREQQILAAAANDAKEELQDSEDINNIELELKEEIVDRYSKLMDEADQQEQKLEWQTRRFQLHEQRLKFFKSEEDVLQQEMQNFLEGRSPAVTSKEVESTIDVNEGSFKSDITASNCIGTDTKSSVSTDRQMTIQVHIEVIDKDCNDLVMEETDDDRPTSVENMMEDSVRNAGQDASDEGELFLESEVKTDEIAGNKIFMLDNDLGGLPNEDLDENINTCSDGSLYLPLSSKVQPYEVDYAVLTSSISQDFMKHLPKASELFDYFNEDEEDTDYLQQTPLPVLMNRSFFPAIHAQAKLVNRAVLDYFLQELSIIDHFNALRNYFFFQDGEFGQTLSQLLFNKMQIGGKRTRYDIFNPFTLKSILNEALSSSIFGENKFSENLTFVVGDQSDSSSLSDFEMLENLELIYKVDWPLNLIITESSMENYNKIWRFLLYVKHLLCILTNTWHCMKQSAHLSIMSSAWQYRKLQVYRHEMLHFVRTIQNFIASEMLQIAWLEFETTVTQKVATVDELQNAHMEYLRNTCKRCLLTKEAKPVMKFVEYLFDLVLKFHVQVSNLPWTWNSDESAFDRLCQIYNDFKALSKTLLLVLRTSVNTRPQQQIVDFLVMLDLSNKYGLCDGQ